MSSILRRKKDGGKISREVSESAARRDTKLERSTEQLTLMRSNSSRHRLQQRTTSGGGAAAATASWPLRDGQDADPQRPSTATGAPPVRPAKTGFLKRRSTSQGVETNPAGVVVPAVNGEEDSIVTGTSGKKKKFGTLRRMFGIHD